MKPRSLLRFLAFATALHLVAFAMGEIEFASAPNPRHAPTASFAFAEDGALEITVSSPVPELKPEAIKVEILTPSGERHSPKPSSTPGVYHLRPSNPGAFRVRMSSSGDIAATVYPKESDVFYGNYVQAIRGLETRRENLDTPQRVDDVFLTAQLQDHFSWLKSWLKEQASITPPSEESPIDGPLASAFFFASEMISYFETGEHSLDSIRGRQLPARSAFKAKDAKSERTVAYDYILRVPEGRPQEDYPLLVIVHGFTTNPNIVGGVRPEIEDAAAHMDFPFITAAPVFNGDMRKRHGWAPDELAGFVESLIQKFPVDRERVYLTGFSMGGLAVNRLAAHRPDLFAATAPLCGDGDPEWAAAMAPVPVYLYHGDKDGAVSCYRSTINYRALKSQGATPELKIYTGVGHVVWDVTYREPSFYEKLLRHRRLPALDHDSIGAIQGRTQSARFESGAALPQLEERYVCWIDKTFTAADLFKGRSNRGETVALLEELYPARPLTGNILVRFPEGLSEDNSPIQLGIAMESSEPLPQGFVLESVRAGGPGGVLRYCANADSLIEGVAKYTALSAADGFDHAGLLLEWQFSDSRDGNRFAIRNLLETD